jgi:dodecin
VTLPPAVSAWHRPDRTKSTRWLTFIMKKYVSGNFFVPGDLFSSMVTFNLLQGRSIASHNQENTAMSAHIYKKLEIVGSSPTSIEEAVNNAVAKAAETIRSIRWVEIVETRCHVEEQKIAYWQVTVKIGFTLDEK